MEGREKKEREMDWLHTPQPGVGREPTTQVHALDQESNLRPFGVWADANQQATPARAPVNFYRRLSVSPRKLTEPVSVASAL